MHVVTIALVVVIVGELVSIVVDVRFLGLLNRDIAGETVSDASWAAHEDWRTRAWWVQTVAFYATAVAFATWLHGAYRRTDPDRRRYATGWAVLGWIIPILNFWRPKQVVNDVAGGSTRLTTAWWLLFLVAYTLADFALRWYPAETRDDERVYTLLFIASELLAVAAAVLAILVVRRLTPRVGTAVLPDAPLMAPLSPS